MPDFFIHLSSNMGIGNIKMTIIRNKTVANIMYCLNFGCSRTETLVLVSYEPCHEKTNILFPTWSDTNQAVQLQKMARGLKFRI